jgi:hypothetical protein
VSTPDIPYMIDSDDEHNGQVTVNQRSGVSPPKSSSPPEIIMEQSGYDLQSQPVKRGRKKQLHPQQVRPKHWHQPLGSKYRSSVLVGYSSDCPIFRPKTWFSDWWAPKIRTSKIVVLSFRYSIYFFINWTFNGFLEEWSFLWP